MNTMTSQITGVSIVYLTVCSGTDQRNHQSSASLAFVREVHRWPVNSPHIGLVTRKMLPFDDVIVFVLPAARVSTGARTQILIMVLFWLLQIIGVRERYDKFDLASTICHIWPSYNVTVI